MKRNKAKLVVALSAAGLLLRRLLSLSLPAVHIRSRNKIFNRSLSEKTNKVPKIELTELSPSSS